MDLTAGKKTYRRQVVFYRSLKHPDLYYIWHCKDDFALNRTLEKMKDRDLPAEVALQVWFQYELNEDEYFSPLQDEYKRFIEYIQRQVAISYQPEIFIENWYQIPELNTAEPLKADFIAWQNEENEKRLKEYNHNRQAALF